MPKRKLQIQNLYDLQETNETSYLLKGTEIVFFSPPKVRGTNKYVEKFLLERLKHEFGFTPLLPNYKNLTQQLEWMETEFSRFSEVLSEHSSPQTVLDQLKKYKLEKLSQLLSRQKGVGLFQMLHKKFASAWTMELETDFIRLFLNISNYDILKYIPAVHLIALLNDNVEHNNIGAAEHIFIAMLHSDQPILKSLNKENDAHFSWLTLIFSKNLLLQKSFEYISFDNYLVMEAYLVQHDIFENVESCYGFLAGAARNCDFRILNLMLNKLYPENKAVENVRLDLLLPSLAYTPLDVFKDILAMLKERIKIDESTDLAHLLSDNTFNARCLLYTEDKLEYIIETIKDKEHVKRCLLTSESNYQQPLLLELVKRCSVKTLKLLIKQFGECISEALCHNMYVKNEKSIDEIDSDEKPLLAAAEQGNSEVVEFILTLLKDRQLQVTGLVSDNQGKQEKGDDSSDDEDDDENIDCVYYVIANKCDAFVFKQLLSQMKIADILITIKHETIFNYIHRDINKLKALFEVLEAECNPTDIIDFILKPCSRNLTLLHAACLNHLPTLEFVLDKLGEHAISFCTNAGSLPLAPFEYACLTSDEEVVKKLFTMIGSDYLSLLRVQSLHKLLRLTMYNNNPAVFKFVFNYIFKQLKPSHETQLFLIYTLNNALFSDDFSSKQDNLQTIHSIDKCIKDFEKSLISQSMPRLG